MFRDPDRITEFAPDVDLSSLPSTFFTFLQGALLCELARLVIYKIGYVENNGAE